MDNKPETIEYHLEASVFKWEIAPGKTIEAWGYNKQVPGPVLKVRKGDTLIVKLTNHLEEKTTIHWHGLRIPAVMDGTEDVQQAVMPGEQFEYRFVIPDAGTYWYHPHVHEVVQMEKGMYGAIIIEDESEPLLDADRLFVIDDMHLEPDGQSGNPASLIPQRPVKNNFFEGETLLVNGKEKPEINIAACQTERWRFINAASTRYFILHLEGKEFKIIGTDGGLLEKPRVVSQLLITPGERMDIAAGPFNEGESFSIQSYPYNRGAGTGELHEFAYIKVGNSQESVAFIPDSFRIIPRVASLDNPVTRTIKLYGRKNSETGVEFTINDKVHLHDNPVQVGTLQVWEINNPSLLDHPFHLHGFFFQVLEVNGKAPEYIAWKDTYNVPRSGSIRIAWMPDDRPGKWMYHCHILDHFETGMMAHFEVINKIYN